MPGKKIRGLRQGKDEGKFKGPQPRKGKGDRQNSFADKGRHRKAYAGLWAVYGVVGPVETEYSLAGFVAARVEGAEVGKAEAWADAGEVSKAEV